MTKANDGVDDVAKLLEKAKVKQLNIVSFRGKILKLNTEEDAKDIVDAITSSKDVQALCLEGNTVGVEAAEAIGAALKKRAELERALWSDMFTGRLRSEIPPAMESLSNGVIAANAKLLELDLSDNAFGPDGVKACTKLITSPPCYTLKVLKFNNNGLGVGGGKILSQALLDNHKSSSAQGKPLALEIFISGRNRLENPGAKELSQAFKVIGTLKEIIMPQNGIQFEGIGALAESFKDNPNLKVINLNDNTFTEKGADAMAKVLPALQNIEVINFGDCLVKTAGAKTLAKAITNSNPKLRELNLSFDEINKEGALAVVESVRNKDNLEKLDLNGNCIGDEGINEVKSELDSQNQLEMLGSLSDDEGDENDDEEDDGLGDEDEDDSEEGEESSDPSLAVKGVSLKPQSPLMGDDVEIEKELNKEASVENAWEFVTAPSLMKFSQLPRKRAGYLIEEAIKNNVHNFEAIAKYFVAVSVALGSSKEALFDCSDAILKHALKSFKEKPGVFANSFLVHLGLLKGEEKVLPVGDLSGPLMALQHVVKQEYFPRELARIFIAFLSMPSKILEPYSQPRHQLLQTLYQL